MHVFSKNAMRVLLLVVPALSACAHAVSPVSTIPPCVAADSSEAIRWLGPSTPADLERSRSGCGSVGPAAIRRMPPGPARHGRGTIFVVSWNVAVGSGRVQSLTRDLVEEERQAGRPAPDFILLLQEARRAGDAFGALPNGGTAARRVSREDVLSVATGLQMSVAYIPSMPNRTVNHQLHDDRGNAILSTLPLRDITALELPFVRQRRVAVIARVDVDGRSLTVVSLHLDTRRPLLKGSIFSGPVARSRQAAAIVKALEPWRAAGAIVIGGDFNTVGGLGEPAIRWMKRDYPRIACGNPITHKWGFSLDHLFASDPSLLDDCDRARQRYGSDHHPLVARLSADE